MDVDLKERVALVTDHYAPEAWPEAKNPWTGVGWTDTLGARGEWPVGGTLRVVR